MLRPRCQTPESPAMRGPLTRVAAFRPSCASAFSSTPQKRIEKSLSFTTTHRHGVVIGRQHVPREATPAPQVPDARVEECHGGAARAPAGGKLLDAHAPLGLLVQPEAQLSLVAGELERPAEIGGYGLAVLADAV